MGGGHGSKLMLMAVPYRGVMKLTSGCHERWRKESVWNNLFSCLVCKLPFSYRHLDHSEEKNQSKSKCSSFIWTSEFWTQCPSRLYCKSWNLCKDEQTEWSDWAYERVFSSKEEGQDGELILNSWLYVPHPPFFGYGLPQTQHPLWFSLSHQIPCSGEGNHLF